MTVYDIDFSRPRQVTIDKESEGQRIDNFLINTLKGVPKSRIYRILRKGEVRINKGRIRPSYRLREGDILRIPPIRVAEPQPKTGPVLPLLQKRLTDSILYEDTGLLVLNKPSGMAVHGGSGLSHGIIETLRTMRPDARYLELVHRLDRDTSGCLMIAKKRSVLRTLHELLRSNRVDKQYLALVKGKWRGGDKRVEAPLRKNMLASGERIVRVEAQGKAAVTCFKPVHCYPRATLVEVTLLTGRTHQIRVHAAHIGHPIAGDEKYGSASFNRQMREQGLSRLFLHAQRLRFRNGVETIPTEFHAPLPEELESVLKNLDKN